MKPKYILGINAVYHESAACLIKNGKIIAAVEEERFNRVKHAKKATIENAMKLPFHAINFCLEKAGITMDEIDKVGYSFDPEKRHKTNIDVDDHFLKNNWGSKEGEKRFLELNKQIVKILESYYNIKLTKKFKFLSHHACHLASAFFVAPYDESAILCVDGIGEIESTSLALGKGNKIKVISNINYPDSLGFLWEKLSQFLGFSCYDACKVMGLASYGDPKVYLDKFKKFIQFNKAGSFKINNNVLQFRTNNFRSLEKVLGPRRSKKEPLEKRHKNIAATLQHITEEILVKLCNKLYDLSNVKNLCIAGGVGLNCVANGKIIEKTSFENVWVQPAANDAGTAIGAAFYIWNQLLNEKRSYVMEHAYLGPEFSDEEIRRVLKGYRLDYHVPKHLEKETAKLIAKGKIVAWFQGSLEFGPRALGNRSILVDPRSKEMKDTLNCRVKHREPFRPFCPSVIKSKSQLYFKGKKSDARKYMLVAVDVVSDKVPAVTHIDNTSRVQEVELKTNPQYYKLIQEFEKLTGVPIVLNTSFNDQEPIVCTPDDAVKTFLKTDIDYLVIGDYIVRKRK